MDALAEAKEKAQTIACVNNLKQIGLAVRIWKAITTTSIRRTFSP